jgi:hypothetical protein
MRPTLSGKGDFELRGVVKTLSFFWRHLVLLVLCCSLSSQFIRQSTRKSHIFSVLIQYTWYPSVLHFRFDLNKSEKTSWSLFDCILWSSRHRWEPVWLSQFEFGRVTTSCRETPLNTTLYSKLHFKSSDPSIEQMVVTSCWSSLKFSDKPQERIVYYESIKRDLRTSI